VALNAARAIQDEFSRSRALSSLAPQSMVFEKENPEFAYSIWVDTVHALSKYTRKAFLADIIELLPFGLITVTEEHKQEIAIKIYRYSQEISKWWP
jgi:hypothetical protein